MPKKPFTWTEFEYQQSMKRQAEQEKQAAQHRKAEADRWKEAGRRLARHRAKRK